MNDAPIKPGGGAAKRCPECGVEHKPELKYCDFCGTKVAAEAVVPAAETQQARRRAGGTFTGLAVVCLAVWLLFHVGNRLQEEKAAPVPPPRALEGKRQAAATCEAGIRDQARGRFRVISFRSALVAEERAGYVVSGTVELQSAAGELQRKRYFCRVHPEARAGMVLDEGRMY